MGFVLVLIYVLVGCIYAGMGMTCITEEEKENYPLVSLIIVLLCVFLWPAMIAFSIGASLMGDKKNEN